MADKNTVELEVIDQLHISSVKADTMRKGERFTVSADHAKSLIERGLAKKAGGAKAAAAPANKAAATPANKAAPVPSAKRGGSRRP
jgi:hypothetical protein